MVFHSQRFHCHYLIKWMALCMSLQELWCSHQCCQFYNPCNRMTLKTLLLFTVLFAVHFLICKESNAHHWLWGSTNDHQNVVKDFLDFNDLVILNDGTGSSLNISTGNILCIDPTICSPALCPDVNGRVDQSAPCVSDHFPVHVCFGWSPHRNSVAIPPWWKLKTSRMGSFPQRVSGTFQCKFFWWWCWHF